MVIIIDGDWIVYKAGFASEKTFYVCPEVYGQQEFGNKTELWQSLEADGLAEDVREREIPFYHRVELDPLNHVLHTAKTLLTDTIAECTKRFGSTDGVVLYLDGDGNFRHQLATIRPYKGNRRVDARPQRYNEIREYLIEHHAAQLVYGQETDDQVSMAMRRYKRGVCVSIDKDLLQIPGHHYNPDKGFRKITPKQGLWLKYVQCLSGDSVDNIMGAYRVGEKRAKQLLDPRGTEAEWWDAVVEEFRDNIRKYPDQYPEGMLPVDAALETMRLVHLRTKADELWLPPTVHLRTKEDDELWLPPSAK